MAVSRRSIFPLTTVWTPPCASVWHRDDIGRASCEPPYRHALDRNQDLHPTGYYSPGICFGGYTSGCQRNHTGEGWTSDSRETAALCVPIGYTCDDTHSNMAYQIRRAHNFANTVTAQPFEVRWKEEDICLFKTHPLTPRGAVTSCESSSYPTETSNPTDTSETSREETDGNGGGGGISRGAAAGIAVGATLFVVLICAGAFIWYRNRHIKLPPPTAEDALDGEKPPGVPSKLGALGKSPRPSPATEMDADQPGVAAASELASEAGERHELAGARTQAGADIAELQGASPRV